LIDSKELKSGEFDILKFNELSSPSEFNKGISQKISQAGKSTTREEGVFLVKNIGETELGINLKTDIKNLEVSNSFGEFDVWKWGLRKRPGVKTL
jgi:hypothetical protein